MAPARPGRQGAPLASLRPKGALDPQSPCRGRIQLLYIYFIACTVTLGGVQKVDDTPAPPCDLAGLDLIFNLFLPRLPYRYGLCAALLAPGHRLPCELLPPGPSYSTRACSPCSVAFVHNKTMEWRQPQAHVESGSGDSNAHFLPLQTCSLLSPNAAAGRHNDQRWGSLRPSGLASAVSRTQDRSHCP